MSADAHDVKVLHIPIGMIVPHERLQMRAGGLCEYHIDRLADLMVSGVPLDPVDVVLLDPAPEPLTYLLADGAHRRAAAAKKGLHTIPARVHVGTWGDAMRLALAANDHRGLSLTDACRRRKVAAVLDAPDVYESIRAAARGKGGVYAAIADACRVSHGLVGKVLAERGEEIRRDGSLHPRVGEGSQDGAKATPTRERRTAAPAPRPRVDEGDEVSDPAPVAEPPAPAPAPPNPVEQALAVVADAVRSGVGLSSMTAKRACEREGIDVAAWWRVLRVVARLDHMPALSDGRGPWDRDPNGGDA